MSYVNMVAWKGIGLEHSFPTSRLIFKGRSILAQIIAEQRKEQVKKRNEGLTFTVYSYTFSHQEEAPPGGAPTPSGRLTPRLCDQTLGLRESISPGPALAGPRLVERPRKSGPFSFAAPQ
jgi:hypothetical protein